MNDVAVPRWALAGVALVVLGLAVALAFQLGRASSAATVPPAPTGAPNTPTTLVTPPPTTAPAVVETAAAAPRATPIAEAPAPIATDPRPPARIDDEREAVRGYLSRVELELASAKDFEDANKAALEVLKDMSGAGVRAMRDDQVRLRARISEIDAPPPCAEYRAALLQSFDRAVSMLDKLASSMSVGDTARLADVAAEGREIEAHARRVDQLAAALKKQYGL